MNQGRIFDTFLFSEPFETEVLLAKLTVESPGVTNWLILENAFTFQGEHKGIHLQSILEQDQRFQPFLDRIHVISSQIKFPVIDSTGDMDQQGLYAEHTQRETARTWLETNACEDDWVLVSDTDELLDCTCPKRMSLLRARMSKCRGGVLPLPRRRFWYDFDNLWRPRRSTPLVSAKTLLACEDTIGSYRVRTIGIPTRWPLEQVFEYSFCGSKLDILRKYDTFGHPGFDPEEITLAISCNRTPVAERQRLEITLDERFWLQPVALTESNSPDYIRRHLAELKTNVVPENYWDNRRRAYPHLFSAGGRVKHFLAGIQPRSVRRRISKRVQGAKRW